MVKKDSKEKQEERTLNYKKTETTVVSKRDSPRRELHIGDGRIK